jgi:signal recognition particle GTPase
VENARERAADERLLALPAEIAADAAPLVLDLATKVPLTGLVLTGLRRPVADAALLVLGPATGVPVQWASFHERGGGARKITPEFAVELLIGDRAVGEELQAVLAPFLRDTVRSPTPLDEMHDVFRRLVRSDRLWYALEQMPRYLRRDEEWDLDALTRQIELVTEALDVMTPTERLHPETIGPERMEEISRDSGSPLDLVRWFLRDYLARRDLAARPRGSSDPGPAPRQSVH